MPQKSGIVSEQELEAYGSANIMLLDGSNDTTSSGSGLASGTISLRWTLRWDAIGFTGIGWNQAWGNDRNQYESAYQNGTLDEVIEVYGYRIADAFMATEYEDYYWNGCADVSPA